MMIDIAEEELDISIRKKLEPEQLNVMLDKSKRL